MTENNEDMHANHIDALHAMAGGEDIATPQDADDQSEEVADHPVEETVAAVDIGVDVDPEEARRSRQTGLKGRVKRAHAEQFKRTMIPLLLVVGAMLLLISVATILMMQTHESDTGEFMGGVGWPMAIGSFVLAAVLMLGAWLFHYEINSNKK